MHEKRPRRGLAITTIHKGTKMKRTRLTGGLVGLLALLLSVNVFADGHEGGPGDISDVWIFKLKRGMETEFTTAMQEHMAARKEMGESRTWYAYRAEVGHHPGLIMYRSAPMSYADHDAYLAEDRDALNDAFGANIDPLVDHFHHYIESYDWENSHWPDDESTEGPLFTAVERKWKPSGGLKSDRARERMSQIALNEGWAEKGHQWLWVERLGGAPVQSLVLPDANYAEMAPSDEEFGPWLAEKVGSEEEASKIFQDWLSGFSAVSVTVWRHDPDLSTPADD